MDNKQNTISFFDFLHNTPGLLVIRRIAQALKRRIKDFSCRMGYGLYHFSIRLTMGAFKHINLVPHCVRNEAATVLGDVGFLILDLLKKSVWRMTGSGLHIVFVGSKLGSLDVLSLFFDGPATHEQIGEISTFGLSRKTREWLDEGCDLVICELSRLHPFRPKTSVGFTVPQWVNQLVTYPDQMNALLAGNRHNSLRRHINRCLKAGYKWQFSQSRNDFDFFYERLYLPFVRSRHGEHALIAPYPFQWDLWIKGAGGGLVLVTHEGKTVAGAVCLVVDGVCYNIEIGVLDADETLLKHGINAYLFWCVAEWGKTQGAKFYNMGGSHGWRSNGTFRWKAKWNSRVIRRKYTSPTLNFAADRISPLLGERINAIGYVREKEECFYSLLLHQTNTRLHESELAERVKRAQKEGLRGVCVIAPETQSKIITKVSS